MTSVRHRQNRADEDAVQGGRAVKAADPWRGLALQSNHLRGRGAMLVPMHAPNSTVSGGNTATWEFRTTVRDASKALIWIVSMTASGTGVAVADVVVGGVTTSVGLNSDEITTVRVRESEDSAAGEIGKTLQIDATNDVDVLAIGLMEEHRAQLDETDRDQGVDLAKLRPGDPIQAHDTGGENHKRRLAESLSTAETGRRVGLWSQSTDTANAYSTSSGDWTELIADTPAFMRGLDLDNSTQAPPTETDAAFRVRAHVSGGATASVRLQTTEGASTTITGISGASFAWYPATGGDPETISIQTEDLSTSDGKRGGSFDHVSVDAKITSGTGTVSVSSVCVWEDEVT